MKHNNHPAHLTPWSRRAFLSNGALGISILGLAGALGFDPAIAQVSGFPNRAVQLVVPFPPGGVVDQTGRAIAQSLFKTWKQPVVINTKPGAGGAAVRTGLRLELLHSWGGGMRSSPYGLRAVRQPPPRDSAALKRAFRPTLRV